MSDLHETLYKYYEHVLNHVKYIDYRGTSSETGTADNGNQEAVHKENQSKTSEEL